MARAQSEHSGRRPRTVYAITAKRRRALADWLAVPGSGPVLEFEALLKVAFADQGSRLGLLANLDAIIADTEARAAFGAMLARQYLNGAGPFPGTAPGERADVAIPVGAHRHHPGLGALGASRSARVAGEPEPVRCSRPVPAHRHRRRTFRLINGHLEAARMELGGFCPDQQPRTRGHLRRSSRWLREALRVLDPNLSSPARSSPGGPG